MGKKNTPESNNPSGSDSGASGKKRRGFISEFDMWDMNLDISGDESIDPTVRTGQFPKQSGAKPPTPAVESRAKTVPMPARKPQQAPVKRKAPDKGNTVANRTHAKVPNPSGNVTARSQAQPNRTRSVPQNNARQSMTRTQPVSPVRTQPVSPTRTQPVAPVKAPPQSQGTQGTGAQSKARPTGANAQPQRDAAVFTTRDVNHRIIPQDINRVEELQKKRQREKILKSVSWIWFIIESTWKGIVRLVKFLGRMMPVLYRHKAVVGAAVISFALGIYFGGSGGKTDVGTTAKSEVAANKTKHVPAHRTKTAPKHQHKQKRNTQRTELAIAPKQLVQAEAVEQNALAQGSTGQENAPVDQALADNQFSGKDIPLEGDVASKPQDTNVTTQSNPPAMTPSTPDSAQAAMPKAPATAQSAKLDDDAYHRLLKINVDYFNQKQWQQVVNTSNQILSLKPFTESALINRSAAYTELGQFSLAVEDANTLISIDKNNGVAFNNRAYAYEKAGNLKYAVKDYTKACNLGVQQSCNDMQRLSKNLSGSQ